MGRDKKRIAELKGIQMLPIKEIVNFPKNPFRPYEEKKLAALAENKEWNSDSGDCSETGEGLCNVGWT